MKKLVFLAACALTLSARADLLPTVEATGLVVVLSVALGLGVLMGIPKRVAWRVFVGMLKRAGWDFLALASFSLCRDCGGQGLTALPVHYGLNKAVEPWIFPTEAQRRRGCRVFMKLCDYLTIRQFHHMGEGHDG